MQSECNRYFIELQPTSSEPVTRHQETEMRRQMATHFMDAINQWLMENEWGGKVTKMAITALGQVQITCEPDIISHIRNREDFSIAAIRPGAPLGITMGTILSDHALRWNEAR